ncbi:MAG: hypothetical protein Q9165_004916 [Trypethelium subeluteriae]
MNKRHNIAQSLIYSPANEILEYNTKLYDLDLLGDSSYFGTPSPQIDENWHELMARMSYNKAVDESDLTRVNLSILDSLIGV